MGNSVEIPRAQRFLRRLYMRKIFDRVLREAAYHRVYHDEENRDGITIWKWDQEEGHNVDPL